jgi:NTP pyrophosphatase (non-canonical NTP hydrolase)
MLKLRELQQLMRELYYHRDSQRGVNKTFIWLISEIGELADSLRKKDGLAQLEEEFADVLAWTASLANLLDINLERALRNKYPGKCPKCQSTPCDCTF